MSLYTPNVLFNCPSHVPLRVHFITTTTTSPSIITSITITINITIVIIALGTTMGLIIFN